MSEQDERTRVCTIAQEWVGTPFHDLGEIKGVGVDCAKLLKCTFRDAGLIPNIAIESYSPQHFLHSREERFLHWVRMFAHEISREQVQPGDVVLYKIGHVYSHGAIVMPPGLPNIIHAWFRSRCVRRAHYLEGDLGLPKRQPRFFSRW